MTLRFQRWHSCTTLAKRHILVVAAASTVCIVDPVTPENKAEWDEILGRRDIAQQEVSYFASRMRRSRNKETKDMYLRSLLSEQRLFDAINNVLRERYLVDIEDRSRALGATLPNRLVTPLALKKK